MGRSLKKSYWGGNGKHEALCKAIQKFIPSRGAVIDSMPALEAFRQGQNAYHDLLNNGGGNRDALILKLAGKDLSDYNIDYGSHNDPCSITSVVNYQGDLCLCKEVNSEDHHHTIYHLWCLCEKALHKLILAAAEEVLGDLGDADNAEWKYSATPHWCERCHQGYQTHVEVIRCLKKHEEGNS